jgi:DNA replication protein DnaC
MLKNTDVLLLDDLGMAAMDRQTRCDLLEIIDDRAGHRATIISHVPIEYWREWIGDQTTADAMLDRLMQSHHRLTLTGESLRKKAPTSRVKADNLPGNV